MNWMTSVMIGALGGILSGVFGIGGGIVLVPLLMFAAGLSQKSAQGTSLAALLLPVGIFAAWKYHKEGHINIPTAAIISVSMAVCAYFGAMIATQVPEIYLRRGFGVLLASVAVKFLFF